MNEAKDEKRMRRKGIQKPKNNMGWIIFWVFLCLLLGFPILLANVIYHGKCLPDCLRSIGGDGDIWIAFWASYSGTVATTAVAYFSWRSSRAISEMQEIFFDRNIGINIRLCKVSISPVLKKDDMSRYKMRFQFKNMSESMVLGMKPENIIFTFRDGYSFKVFLKDDKTVLYRLQGDMPVLEFVLQLKDAKQKKKFAGFYFYYSQFPPGKPQLTIEMEMRIKYGDERKEDEKGRVLTADIIPEPGIDYYERYTEVPEEEYQVPANRFSLITYSLSKMPG